MDGRILFAAQDGVHVLKFVGDVRVTLGPAISGFLDKIGNCASFQSIIIDLSETVGIDSTSLGLLAKIAMRVDESFGAVPTVISTNDDITRILLSMGFDQVFVIVRECGEGHAEGLAGTKAAEELPCGRVSEGEMRQQVLEAHRALMSMNDSNHATFKDLVNALESEASAGR